MTASVWPAWTWCGERRRGATKRSRRARPCVGRSPAALSGASTASLSTALGAAELLGSQRVRERCELRVVKRLARVPEEAVNLGVARKRTRRAGSERTQRSTSASWRFLFKLSRRASSNAGHAHFVLAAQQRAHRGPSSTWDCRTGRARRCASPTWSAASPRGP
jgi:hypothetical protein